MMVMMIAPGGVGVNGEPHIIPPQVTLRHIELQTSYVHLCFIIKIRSSLIIILDVSVASGFLICYFREVILISFLSCRKVQSIQQVSFFFQLSKKVGMFVLFLPPAKM